MKRVTGHACLHDSKSCTWHDHAAITFHGKGVHMKLPKSLLMSAGALACLSVPLVASPAAASSFVSDSCSSTGVLGSYSGSFISVTQIDPLGLRVDDTKADGYHPAVRLITYDANYDQVKWPWHHYTSSGTTAAWARDLGDVGPRPEQHRGREDSGGQVQRQRLHRRLHDVPQGQPVQLTKQRRRGAEPQLCTPPFRFAAVYPYCDGLPVEMSNWISGGSSGSKSVPSFGDCLMTVSSP